MVEGRLGGVGGIPPESEKRIILFIYRCRIRDT